MRALHCVCAVLALSLAGSPALAKDPVKIGLITTLTGPAGYLGADIRDGFMLAVEAKGGPFEGNKPEVLIEDDGWKPGQGKTIADRFLKTNNVKILTGIVFGHIAAAVVPDALDAGAIYVSPNSAATGFAGKGCHPNYFVVSFQNDGQGESVGALAKSLGYKKAFILAPNYPSGKDMLQAFKRQFGGEIIDEKYTRLDQTDFAVEIAAIRSANPEVVHAFQPGGLGITFLRQYHQAGLRDKIPLVMHAASLDQAMVKVLGDAAVGIQVASQWNDDFDNPASKAFVEAWRAKYGKRPVTSYASQGYDAGMLIGSALKATGFSTDNMDALRAAMRKADFPSVRGNFKFDKNQHPIQDWYALKAEKTPGGEYVLKTGAKVLSNHGDIYAKDCAM
jgi:branched-chain amino acid transport system substrate-binding protein